MVPFHTRPVVQPLQRQVDVFVGFQFHHRQAARMRGGEHIDHGPVRGGKRRNLRIPARRLQPPIHYTHVAHHQRLQPSLRAQTPQRILTRSIRMASIAQTMCQLRECILVMSLQNALLRAHSEHDLLSVAERSWDSTQSRAGELQPAPAKNHLRRRQHGDFAIR